MKTEDTRVTILEVDLANNQILIEIIDGDPVWVKPVNSAVSASSWKEPLEQVIGDELHCRKFPGYGRF